MKKLTKLIELLDDERKKEVVFISHCLLNINTRYLGGAFRKGSVNELIEGFLKQGIGIVQMKCPEQWAWGGILKKYLWIAYDSKATILYLLKPVALALFLLKTRIVYKALASETAGMITEYVKAGFKVAGIVGVDGSPSCGVNVKLDMKKAYEYFSAQKLDHTDRDTFNKELYRICAVSGRGMFIDELIKRLDSKRLNIPVFGHSLMDEMKGKESIIDL